MSLYELSQVLGWGQCCDMTILVGAAQPCWLSSGLTVTSNLKYFVSVRGQCQCVPLTTWGEWSLATCPLYTVHHGAPARPWTLRLILCLLTKLCHASMVIQSLYFAILCLPQSIITKHQSRNNGSSEKYLNWLLVRGWWLRWLPARVSGVRCWIPIVSGRVTRLDTTHGRCSDMILWLGGPLSHCTLLESNTMLATPAWSPCHWLLHWCSTHYTAHYLDIFSIINN